MINTAQVQATNGEIMFKVKMQPGLDGNPIHDFFISLDDGGTYSPHYVQEIPEGMFGAGLDCHSLISTKSLRDLLVAIAAETVKRREADKHDLLEAGNEQGY